MKTIIRSLVCCLFVTAFIVAINIAFPDHVEKIDTTVYAVEDYSDCGVVVKDVICEIPKNVDSDQYIYASFLTDDICYRPGQNITLTVRYTFDDWEILDIQ